MAADRVLILGAGYAGLRVALDLARLEKTSRDPLEIVLVNKHNYHQLVTQLHEPAAGGEDYENVRISLHPLLRRRHVELLKATVSGLDRQACRVQLAGERDEPYDYLVVALGSQPEYFGIPGLEEYSFTLRSLNTARLIRTHIENMLALAKNIPFEEERQACLTFVVGGAGLTGVEMAGELAAWLRKLSPSYDVNPRELQLINIEAAPTILPGFDSELVEYARRILSKQGVEFLTGTSIARVTAQQVDLQDGRNIPTRTLIWAGGVKGSPLLAEAGLTTAGRGRAVVNPYLQSVDDPRIYVCGDSALVRDPESGQPLAPNAQLAVSQGKVAACNIHAQHRGLELRVFRPHNLGLLASLGPGQGVGKIKSLRTKGLTAALAKEVVPLRYLYSLGGMKLVAKRFM